MIAVLRLFLFILISFAYWAAATIYLFATMLPCGMGPDADCDEPGQLTMWLAAVGVILIYAAIRVFLRGRWIAK